MPSYRAIAAAGGLAVLYCAGVTWYLLTHGGSPTPDFLIPPLVLPALLLRRGRAFIVDWAPFLLLLLAWEATRGIADRLGMPVHIGGPITVEKALFFGHVPTVELQHWLYDPDRGSRWFDWAGAIIHSLHFVLPVAFGFALWLHSRPLFRRYVVSILALFLLSFAGYVLYPQAPPWMAGTTDAIPFVWRIGVGTIISIPVGEPVVLAYNHIRPNDVAAMPSLHAALPLLLTMILWRLKRSLVPVAAAYTLVLAFFLVYHGEHYVVDILAGWALAVLVYWLVWATPAWLSRRLPAPGPARRRALAVPATAVAALLMMLGLAAVLRPEAFGAEPSVLTPQIAEEEPAVDAQPAADGPCGQSRTFALQTDSLLAPVAGVYAAYLIDPVVGVCLALTSDQRIPPPNLEDVEQIAAQTTAGDVTLARSAAVAALGAQMRVASGSPGRQLSATGVPPGTYLLVVLLEDVPNLDAAQSAATAVATLVFGWS